MSSLDCIFESIGSVVLFLDDHHGALTVLATGVIGYFSYRLWRTNKDQLKHNRVVERAYVAMSHYSDADNPGLVVDEEQGTVTVVMEIKNDGHTPASITDAFLDLAFGSLPAEPSYAVSPNHVGVRHFLMPGAMFNITSVFRNIDGHRLLAVTEEETRLWLYGYVDYKDCFGGRHRNGYMRRYRRFDRTKDTVEPELLVERTNNLTFDSTPGYNYDRPRRVGEGNDWDDS